MLSLQILKFNAICIKLERVLIEHIGVRYSVCRLTRKRCEEATNGPCRCQIKALSMLTGRPALTAGGELIASLSCVANFLTGNRCGQMFGKLHLREPLSSQVHAGISDLTHS